ncbi:sarcosine oxidase subunit alpha family protein [Rhodopila sp.]|uniref:sarcosine oxidase subunit alpha family protein n=1 Tax=Rhodopila sp. TaxID=2480087 RepID=UPI003D130915
MTQPFRASAGGRINRADRLRFTFDGRPYSGFAGDTLASALLANGVHLVGRSFKYHRPRGIISTGAEEPNALVTVDRGAGRITPNLRVTQIGLYDGLTVHSQNRYPSLGFDLGAVAGLAGPLLAAGFYHKTFMWPRSFWHRLYEPAIRRAAGLGKAPRAPDPDRYLHQYAHCDVLVIGGGPAGLSAALGASVTGERVILCDEQPELGGCLLAEPAVTIDGWAAADWVREAVATLSRSITLLPRTTAFGWYPDQMIGLVQRLTDHVAAPDPAMPRERLWQVRAGRVILATGAIERPLVFPGNDRPGVMLAGAARTYLHRYGIIPGRRVLLATADDSAYRTAADLHDAGIAIAAIVDQRAAPEGEAIEAVRARRLPVHTGTTIAGTKGRMRIRSAGLANGIDVIPCDTLLMSGGWTPSVHLHSQSRRPLMFHAASGTFLPTDEPGRAGARAVESGRACAAGSVGACAGVFDLAVTLHDGTAAGGGAPRLFSVMGLPAMAPSLPPLPAAPHPKAFVDFGNDVTTRDLAVAMDEGFRSIEHVKRYTTTGMATDQGKTSNLNALATVAGLTGQGIEAIGQTSFRPPYTPVTFGSLAGPFRGKLFAPERLPPIAVPGAVLEDVGNWKRARCFPHDNETIQAAVARECRAVRTEVGIFDASTLGKIEVAGADAEAFLNRIYTGDFSTLHPGRCRYAILLGEDGFIRDDGIVGRLSADRFHVTTTTGGAASVLHHMEDYLQTEFFGMRAWLTSITEQWAVIAVQGPRSADILGPFIPDIDLGAMPHMSVREGHIGDIPVRLFRVSFTGEMGFEINLPPDQAQRVWDTLLQRDVMPYGTDAMHILRAEKGYIVIGQDTDGTVIADDLGLDWTISRVKSDFVGKRSLSRPDMLRADRKQLVGLLPIDPAVVLEEGAQVIEGRRSASLGHVTSAYHSPVLDRGFAMALVSAGRARIGSVLLVPMVRALVRVTVTEPLFYDKSGERPHASPGPRPPGASLLPATVTPAPVARPAASVRLAALTPATRLCVRAATAAATAIGLAIGVLLPTVPCRSMTARNRAALWLGPDEWLILAPEADTMVVAQAMRAAADQSASVVDVSHQAGRLEVTGPRAEWCLNAFCALDLDLVTFPVGMCTRTLLGKAEVILWRIGVEAFQVDITRSFMPYVWACLEEARLEFMVMPRPPTPPPH